MKNYYSTYSIFKFTKFPIDVGIEYSKLFLYKYLNLNY